MKKEAALSVPFCEDFRMEPVAPIEAARHICEEARIVLSSLRNGPQFIARGELAQSLRDLRRFCQSEFLDRSPNMNNVRQHDQSTHKGDDAIEFKDGVKVSGGEDAVKSKKANDSDEIEKRERGESVGGSVVVVDPPSISSTGQSDEKEDFPTAVGPYAYPFLSIILDPRAAGPHTLIALRSLHRLVYHGSIVPKTNSNRSSEDIVFDVQLQPLMRGILECRFEQTDVGSDEAVEMAIADFLSLLVRLNRQDSTYRISSEVLIEAFNTVFVTRNTFVHSPALCYHFEEAIRGMVVNFFQDTNTLTQRFILEFFINQLLHTPMNGVDEGDSIGSSMFVSGPAEAHAMHDGTRILCLKMIRTCLKTKWDTARELNMTLDGPDGHLLRLIQDDLCLSILMIGQSIWAYQNPSSQAVPGMISLEVLSEICSTVSLLWSISHLRNVLTVQFESIFTGFYQRALSLLRKLPTPIDSSTFHTNQIFDAEVEIICESLVDILCLHSLGVANKEGRVQKEVGALETLFETFDCNVLRSDVAIGLIVELCRCCGGQIDGDGMIISLEKRFDSSDSLMTDSTRSMDSDISTPNRQSSGSNSSDPGRRMVTLEGHELQLRYVPAHLRELCAEALVGSIKTLSWDLSQSQTNYEEVTDEGTRGEPIKGNNEHSLRAMSHKKSLLRQAAKIFNEKPSRGISFLSSCGILEDQVSPTSVASFLRNGIVVGLDKRKVGEYLGEKGKSPVAGKSPPDWERDWFHKETLQAYCFSFQFENQTLIDGLRMFLAAFRLPGEAQQIDRILQNFAESCGLKCVESQPGTNRAFSKDPKKASDAAYLLSFSIIMLNTDLHNDNIRPDRKMKVEDFIRNNTDYGRDITDPGDEFPREFLENIYSSIRDEEIRTEGEGAEGIMTFERWKDVLRGGNTKSDNVLNLTSIENGKERKELIVKSVVSPVLAAICGFWGILPKLTSSEPYAPMNMESPTQRNKTGMLGSQCARLGMDVCTEMLRVLKKYAPVEVFRDFFVKICFSTGLLGDYRSDAVQRTMSFLESVERQSAVVMVIKNAIGCADIIGKEGWKCVWGIVFELRDLKLLGTGKNNHQSLVIESDEDLLQPHHRREWEMSLMKECYEASGGINPEGNEQPKSGLLGAMGRVFFGSTENIRSDVSDSNNNLISPCGSNHDNPLHLPSKHGKEDQVLWDDMGPSDEEDEFDSEIENDDYEAKGSVGSLGHAFERQLILENSKTFQGPVTGLETYEDTRIYQMSPRGRVRRRLSQLCDFSALVAESRFLETESVKSPLCALIELIKESKNEPSRKEASSTYRLVLSPASEALGEILICEIALKNRDRLSTLWDDCLEQHYFERLKSKEELLDVDHQTHVKVMDSGIEKCVTGLLRICNHSTRRDDINSRVLNALKLLYPPKGGTFLYSSMLHLNKHLGEGLWRICRDVDGLQMVRVDGWEGLLGLIQHCASNGESITLGKGEKSVTLFDDDPALQAFRCMHLMLHSTELKDVIPFGIVASIRSLITGGERQNCPKLSIAGLDLLLVLHTRLQSLISQPTKQSSSTGNSANVSDSKFWISCWRPIIEGMADAANSRYSNTRQHSIAMLVDALIDRHFDAVSINELCHILTRICLPRTGQRFEELTKPQGEITLSHDEIMIEFELCISMVFKPFLHHIKKISSNSKELATIWTSVLDVIAKLLDHPIDLNDSKISNDPSILQTTKELATERLRNALVVLVANGVLRCDTGAEERSEDFSCLTWKLLSQIKYCEEHISDWKQIRLDMHTG